MLVEERFYFRQGRHEILRQHGKRYLAADDQQADSMTDNCFQFVGRKRDALILAAVFQPLFVRTVRWKQIMMPLDAQAGRGKNFGKAFA